jgi:N-acetylglucosaminyldiphosphoundecaprenol N-acetyl-beta-D-mannosaminyltransferase
MELLGVRVQALTRDALTELVASRAGSGAGTIIANHNLHSVALSRSDSSLAEFYREADFVHVDGMALVFLGWLLGLPLRREHRVTYVDWLPSLLSRAESDGWRIFFLGGAPGVAAQALIGLRERFPRLQAASHHGFFDADSADANTAVLDEIAGYRPNLLLVGMGMPRQELWIRSNAGRIRVDVILPVGACLDYFAGEIPTPPRWLGPLGLEWAFRLASEPRRLWRRYLVEPFTLIPAVLQDVRRRVRNTR